MYLYVILAAAGALYFAVTAAREPRPGVIIAAIMWLLYVAYEVLIANGTLCDANCNIRVDLLLIWPLLGLVSLFGLYPPGKWTGPGKTLARVGFGFVALVAALFLYMMLVEGPAAEHAARAKNCVATGQGGPECPPAVPSADSASGAQ